MNSTDTRGTTATAAEDLEAVAAAWTALGLWPSSSLAEALQRLTELRCWADQRQLSHLGDLTGDTAAAWIATAAGVASLTQFADQATRHRIHTARNTLLAAHLTHALLTQAPTGTAAAPHLPALPATIERIISPTTRRFSSRVAYDDEIAVLRITATRLLDSDAAERHSLTVAGYALLDAGAAPFELTTVTEDAVHLDDAALAPSPADAPARVIPLDAWQRATLAHCVSLIPGHDRGRGRPLVYGGRHPASRSAQCSTAGATSRLIARSGLPAPRVSGLGISRWRAVQLARADQYSTAATQADVPRRTIHRWLEQSLALDA